MVTTLQHKWKKRRVSVLSGHLVVTNLQVETKEALHKKNRTTVCLTKVDKKYCLDATLIQ